LKVSNQIVFHRAICICIVLLLCAGSVRMLADRLFLVNLCAQFGQTINTKVIDLFNTFSREYLFTNFGRVFWEL
jgi:hypothetical protein